MTEGPDFFDSNVIIAGALPAHPQHAACAARLAALQRSGGACAAHSLSETYSQLTNPKRYSVPAADAFRIVERIGATMQLISLTPEEVLAAIQSCSNFGVVGGTVYDGLLVACARKINAGRIYTYNLKHFQKVAPDLASRMQLP